MWTFWFSNFLLALFPFPTSPIKRDMKLYSLRLKPLEQSSMLAMTDINLEQSMKNINWAVAQTQRMEAETSAV